MTSREQRGRQAVQREVPRGLCHCGCGRRTSIAAMTNRKHGHVRGEPVRYCAGHAMRHAADRKGPKWEEDPATGCWIAQHRRTAAGYARMSRDGKEILAHRWMYERHVGSIPEGLELDHLCSNPRCCNPSHLEPVTHTENVRRSVARRGVMTAEWAAEIRASGASAAELALRFGVTRTTVYSIRNGDRWAV